MRAKVSEQNLSIYQKILNNESSGGVLLILCTIFSLTITNTMGGESSWYFKLWELPLFGKNVAHWINDGLMTLFFLHVGLELKQDIYYGELHHPKTASLPIAAAIGGMVVPAFIYLLLNFNHPDTIHGIGIPVATDIAFAVAVLTLIGKSVPISLRLFLLALAIIDDLGAIVIIALFYPTGDGLSFGYLFGSLGVLALLLFINLKLKVRSFIPYIIGGIIAWYFMLNSGVHATISGVILAFTFPSSRYLPHSPSFYATEVLDKPVAFIVLPLFALASTAIVVDATSVSALTESYGLGVALGLVVGKPIGITLASYLVCKMGLGVLPKSINWKMVFGAGMLGGIGFTMSIFITLLAFDDALHINNAKFSIIVSSTIAAILGFIYLKIVIASHRPQEEIEETTEANA